LPIVNYKVDFEGGLFHLENYARYFIHRSFSLLKEDHIENTRLTQQKGAEGKDMRVISRLWFKVAINKETRCIATGTKV